MDLKKCAVCNIPAALHCGRCQVTVYCGEMHQKHHWAAHKRMCVAPHKPEEPLLPTGVIFIRNEGECVWTSINDDNPCYCYLHFAKNPLFTALQKCIREFTDRTGLNFETVWHATCARHASKEETAIRSNVDLIIHLHRAGFLDLTVKEFPITLHGKKGEGWAESYTKIVNTPIRPLFHVWCNKGKPIVIPPQMLEFAKICLKSEAADCCGREHNHGCLIHCDEWKYEFHGEKVLFHPTA